MKKTIGQQVAEHNDKNIQFEDAVHEYSLAMGQEQWKRITQFATETSQSSRFRGKNFYIQLIHNIERRLHEPRWVIDIPRMACPTPCYSTSVWKYHALSGELEFLWHLPSRAKCAYIMKNLRTFSDNPVSRNVAQFVYAAETGKLLAWVKKENGEKPDGIVSFKEPHGRSNPEPRDSTSTGTDTTSTSTIIQ